MRIEVGDYINGHKVLQVEYYEFDGLSYAVCESSYCSITYRPKDIEYVVKAEDFEKIEKRWRE